MTKGPKVEEWVLKNGANCVLAPIEGAPLTSIDFWCKAGSYYEKPGEEGLAHFLEHMVFKGSEKLQEGEFDLMIEELGGSSNAATGLDDVHYHVLVPPNEVSKAIELLLNLVLKPSIKRNAYSKEREVVLEEIAQSNDQPEESFLQTLLENCWQDHPYGRPILGTSESLKCTSPKSMKDFHKRLYVPKNMALAIAGEIPKNIKKVINNSDLGRLTQAEDDGESLMFTKKLNFYKGYKEIKLRRLESSRLAMAWPLAKANNVSEIIGADMATTLLAEGRRSRLINKLREELKIVESIDMYMTVLEEGGLIVLEASCLEKNLEKVEVEINKLLKESIEALPSKKEIDRSRKLVENSLYFSLEVPSQISSLLGSQTLWGRNYSLLEPLTFIKEWDEEHIQSRMLRNLQPEESFTLIAKPTKDES